MKTICRPVCRTLAIALLAGPSVLRGADFYPLVSVETTTVNFFDKDNLIQGPGVGFDAEEPHDAIGATWVTDAPGGFPSNYIEVAGEPVIVVDLGQDLPLNEISVWGYVAGNANGIREFSLRFATAAEGNEGFGSSITYNPLFEAELDPVPRQSFGFDQLVTARYVELTGVTTFHNEEGNPPGGDRAGLGEIAFEVPAVTGEPNIIVPDELVLELAAESISMFTIEVRNTGDENLSISSATLAGVNAPAFKVNAVASPIAGLSSGLIEMQFNPAGLGGVIAATLQITSDDPDTPMLEVSLSGNLPELGPDIVVSTQVELALTGAVESFSIPITNSGGQDLVISGTELTGKNAAAFSVVSTPETIPAGESLNVQVEFNPAGVRGGVSALLEISSNDETTPVASVELLGGLPAEFYGIDSVVTSTVDTDLFSGENLIQGIDVGFEAAWPHDALGGGPDFTWVTAAPGGFPSNYIEVAGEPTIVLDLGDDVPLSEISVWGYSTGNANGLSKFSLKFATSAEGAESFGASISYNPTFEPFLNAVPRQSFPFEETVFARYVELTGKATFYSNGGNGPPPGGDRAGLGEIAFEILPVIGGRRFEIVSLELTEAGALVTFTSRPGVQYSVERSTDLSESGWEELDDGLDSDGDTIDFLDQQIPQGASALYYRAKES
ncbi:MAG: choice-of-anchor D domain-containing protein [Verrucomicrobia bacterium]|nr:choice-of-anchor D domain-containing protein [Verrucomicrobiota bacterium]